MMKIKSLKFIGIITLIFLLSGCDLGLQEEFDFKPEALTENPFENMTAWEWIQSRSNGLQSNGRYNVVDFDYLEAAIRKADMVEEFNQVATKDRTYLLLNNNAFTGGGDVIQIITGSGSAAINNPVNKTADETMELVNTPAKLEKLKNVLRYHIVTTYILQVPTLFTQNVDYLFQTLIPGDDGLISFTRTTIWQIQINGPTAPLPTTATSQFENVLNHNYQFKNGIGHVIADPVQNKPY